MSAATTGIDQAIENASRDWWWTGAMVAIKQLARTGKGFDAGHLLDLVGQPPAPEYVGCIFAVAQRAKIIESVGARIGRDGRPHRVWWGLPVSADTGTDG